MKKNKLFVLALSLASIATLASCGGDDGDKTAVETAVADAMNLTRDEHLKMRLKNLEPVANLNLSPQRLEAAKMLLKMPSLQNYKNIIKTLLTHFPMNRRLMEKSIVLC